MGHPVFVFTFPVLGLGVSVLGGEDSSHAGIRGVKSDNMSCVCDLRNCHCAHDDFNTDHEG